MQHLVTNSGEVLMPGAMLVAVKGPVSGSRWRYEHPVSRGGEQHMRCSRLHKVGRVFSVFHPSVFGIQFLELRAWYRITRHDLRHVLGKLDDYLFAGVIALVPLGLYEHFHWSEDIAALLGRF